MCYVWINVGSTFYVNYASNLNDALTQCLWVHFPHTQLVRQFSKFPFGSYESFKSDQCKILRTDTRNDFIQHDVSFRPFGSKFVTFLKMNNMYWY